MLKQAGVTTGDKYLDGDIPNMKLGEYRYYPQDNSNLTIQSRDKITRKAFIRILKKCFPEYIINPEIQDSKYIEAKYYVGSVGTVIELKNNQSMYEPVIINKGYICFKEATSKGDGTILYLHNGVVMAYKERYIKATSK